MRGAKEKNPDPRMIQFREKLVELGYTEDTICGYCSGVRRYVETGRPLKTDKAIEYFIEAEKSEKSVLHKHKLGIIKFIEFIEGKPIVRRARGKSGKGRKRFFGCDEDCFNCKYSDCIMPDYCCTSIPYEQWTGYVTREGKNDSYY